MCLIAVATGSKLWRVRQLPLSAIPKDKLSSKLTVLAGSRDDFRNLFDTVLVGQGGGFKKNKK